MGNENSTESGGNNNNENRRPEQKKASSVGWGDVAMGVGLAAAAAGLTYVAAKNIYGEEEQQSESKPTGSRPAVSWMREDPDAEKVYIAVDATDKKIGGYCIYNIKSDGFDCKFYAGVDHDYENDPTVFEYENVKRALNFWKSHMQYNNVKVYNDNNGALHRLGNICKDLKSEYECNELIFEHSDGEIRKAADQLSRGKIAAFTDTLTNMYPGIEIRIIDESSRINSNLI